MKWIVSSGILIALVVLVAPGRETQIQGIPEVKLGFVDLSRLFDEYHRTKMVTAEFEARWNEAQEELDQKVEQFEELEDQLRKQGNALSEQQRKDLERRIEQARREARDYQETRTKALLGEKREMERDLLAELRKAVTDYGTSAGYSMIFNKSMLLYGAQTFDLTDDVLKRVNSGKATVSG